MRLGSMKTIIREGSKAHDIYKKTETHERHRHRYEVNPLYMEKYPEYFSGNSQDYNIADIFEIKTNKFYVGCQFHPEYKTHPSECHPLFENLIKSASL